MANRTFHDMRSLDRSVIALFGVVPFSTSGAVGTVDALGFTVTKPAGTGLYRITLADKYNEYLGGSIQMFDGGAAPTDVIAHLDAELSSSTILDFRLTRPGKRDIIEYQRAADGAANTTTAETAIGFLYTATTLVAARIVPTAALTADNTNNAVFTLAKYTSAGATKTTVASLTTNVASGDWVAFAPKAMTLAGSGAPTIAAGSSISLEVAKGGSGVQAGTLNVQLIFEPTTAQGTAEDATSGHKARITIFVRNTSSPRKGL